jgi:hypothetical protein
MGSHVATIHLTHELVLHDVQGCEQLRRGRAAHEGSLATSCTREEPAREAAAGPREGAPGRRAGWPRRAELRDTRARPHAPGAGSKPREREGEAGQGEDERREG